MHEFQIGDRVTVNGDTYKVFRINKDVDGEPIYTLRSVYTDQFYYARSCEMTSAG